MSEQTGKYPGFNKIEIIAELERPAQRTLALKTWGETHNAGNMCLPQFFPFSLAAPNSVLTRKLSDSLLVVSFFSNAWLTYGLQYKREVDQLQYIISTMGVQFMALEQNLSYWEPALNISDYSLNLHFYFNPLDLVSNEPRTFPKEFYDPETNFSEKSKLVRLAGYIIDGFYKVALSHTGIPNNFNFRKPLLQYA